MDTHVHRPVFVYRFGCQRRAAGTRVSPPLCCDVSLACGSPGRHAFFEVVRALPCCLSSGSQVARRLPLDLRSKHQGRPPPGAPSGLLPAGTGKQASQGETLKDIVLRVDVDGTGVPRCHSPEGAATRYQYTVGAHSMSPRRYVAFASSARCR